jgi:hypothetical protein
MINKDWRKISNLKNFESDLSKEEIKELLLYTAKRYTTITKEEVLENNTENVPDDLKEIFWRTGKYNPVWFTPIEYLTEEYLVECYKGKEGYTSGDNSLQIVPEELQSYKVCELAIHSNSLNIMNVKKQTVEIVMWAILRRLQENGNDETLYCKMRHMENITDKNLYNKVYEIMKDLLDKAGYEKQKEEIVITNLKELIKEYLCKKNGSYKKVKQIDRRGKYYYTYKRKIND